MEHKTKFQYSYFIYPYIIQEEKYEKYLERILKNPKFKLKMFEKEKDAELYKFFLPQVRNFMFWSFEIPKNKIKELYELPESTRAAILANYDCNIFSYELPEVMQGKVVDKDGIFFDIRKIELVCFKPGICFMVFKTTINDKEVNIDDILNFNCKFREINSNISSMKQYENIKIQSGVFKDVKSFTEFIQEIAGKNTGAKDLNIDTDRFIIYTYSCLDQEEWKEENKENLNRIFQKMVQVLPADANFSIKRKGTIEKEEFNSAMFGFAKSSTVLINSDKETLNFTKIPHVFENEFFYSYIFLLYRKYYLQKLNYKFKKTNNFEKIKKEFLKFTQNIWIQEITNDEMGDYACRKWEDKLGTLKIFQHLKNKYDILYKDSNIERNKKTIRIITVLMIVIVIMLILNIG